MKVYVAGSSDEVERAEGVIARLRAAGIVVTSTWPDNVRRVGASNPRDATREMRGLWAHRCLEEVESSQVLLFLAPAVGPGRGGYYEHSAARSASSSRPTRTRSRTWSACTPATSGAGQTPAPSSPPARPSGACS